MILTQSKTLLDAKVILKVSMTEWKSLRYVSTNIFFVEYSFVSNTFLLNLAICKSRNGESGNGMRGMMGMRGTRVGMRGMEVVIRGIWVGMREIMSK